MIKRIIALGIFTSAMPTLAADIHQTALHTVDSFEKIFGITEGKRRNHTKGFCFKGVFLPHDKAIEQYTNSPLFSGKSNVIGRLSHKGGNNTAPDNKPAEYGMALSITTTQGKHLMSMNTLDFFPVATPEAFAELMHAKAQGPAAVKAFKNKNTDLQRFKAHVAKKPKVLTPYEGSTFNSINSFYLVNTSGQKTAVRWSFVPAKPQAIVLKPQQNFFFNNMQRNLQKQDIVWNMIFTFANDNDAINNAAIAWTGQRKQIIAAKLQVHSISTEQHDQCDDINYDPLVLSPGFEPSADPLLQARRSSYAISFAKRLSEKNNRQHLQSK